MVFSEELHDEVKHIFGDQWNHPKGYVVPDPKDLTLGNDAREIEAVVLYADIDASTALVDSSKPHFAAEVYKAYLHCAGRIMRYEGGAITAYDGDRIMAVFKKEGMETSAVRAALKLNYARSKIIQPALKAQYPNQTYVLNHVIGIDRSELWVARTGVRGANDLVWVGRAANHAAKLCTLGSDYPTWITAEIYNSLENSAKFTDGKSMWESRTWNTMNRSVYRSNWTWGV